VVLAIACGILAVGVVVALAAPQPIDQPVRVTQTGGGTDGRTGDNPRVAFNPDLKQYLVVWRSDVVANDHFEVYAQRLSLTGAKLGQKIRISQTTNAGSDRTVGSMSVAYDPDTQQYLVVWWGDGLATDNEFEIFGQFVSGAGSPVGGDFRISNATDSPLGVNADAARPDVVYNHTNQQYLVVWDADEGTVNEDNEVWGQRLNGAGTEQGSDFQISNASDVAADRDALFPRVVYNPQANEYLVVFGADEVNANAATNSKFEVFGQRLTAAGAQTPTTADFRISNTGSDTDANRDAGPPAVAYDSANNRYLVAFEADRIAPDEVPIHNKQEIYIQRLSAAGTQIPNSTDFRISTTGPQGSGGSYDSNNAAVAFAAPAHEYLVSWDGENFAPDWPEIDAQRISPAGAKLGSKIRITRDVPDQSASVTPDAAWARAAREYMTVYLHSTRNSQDYDPFARRVGTRASCAGQPATRQGTPQKDTINGGSKADVIALLGAKDVGNGGGGNDKVCGGGGTGDTVRGNGGNDHLDGGPGGGDKCIGGPGTDTFAASCETKIQ
jgi:hypothetical protein